ncbi:MAG: serpin family protein [bacterium]
MSNFEKHCFLFLGVFLILIQSLTSADILNPEDYQIAMGNNSFGIEMYRQLSRDNTENIFFSPFSLYTSLSILYEGADGSTRQKIKAVLEFYDDDQMLRSGFESIMAYYNSITSQNQLILANALWFQQDYPVSDDFIKIIQQYYQGEIEQLDFYNQSDQSAQQINRWIFEKTLGKIENIVGEEMIDPLTVMILTNAIYFRGVWKYQFDPEMTDSMFFFVTSERKVKVPMMLINDEDLLFDYAENELLQALELPYEGENLVMTILLPKQDLSEFEPEFDYENLNEILDDLHPENVTVYLPRFSFNSKYIINDYLSDLGLGEIFSSDSDFSRINSRNNLFVNLILHQALVEVNEQGTEAVAATVVMIAANGHSYQKVFYANRPFIFMIRDRQTGCILFMGRLVDPSV